MKRLEFWYSDFILVYSEVIDSKCYSKVWERVEKRLMRIFLHCIIRLRGLVCRSVFKCVEQCLLLIYKVGKITDSILFNG